MSLIILEAIQGGGKTTLGKEYMESNPKAIFLEEWVDEKVLKEYLDDIKGRATEFQFYIQEETVNRIKKAIDLVKAGKVVILDRGLTGNECFARVQHNAGYISSSNMERYKKTFSYDKIPGFKDIKSKILYMKISPELALERIRLRGRAGEESYTLQYLKQISNLHDTLLANSSILYVRSNESLVLSLNKYI